MVVHEMLAAHLPNYQVETYSPKWEYLLPLMPLIKPSHADILHTAPDHGVLLVRRRQRFVATFHGFMLDSGLRPYNTFVQSLHYRTDLRFLVSRALARADVVTAVSQFTAGMVREELGFHGHIEVVPNAVDTQMFHPGSEPRESDRFVALFAGNNSLHKGVQWLPSIANRLDQHITIRCIGARDQYRGMGRGIEVLPGVRRSSMPDIYRSADLLLLPTVREPCDPGGDGDRLAGRRDSLFIDTGVRARWPRRHTVRGRRRRLFCGGHQPPRRRRRVATRDGGVQPETGV